MPDESTVSYSAVEKEKRFDIVTSNITSFHRAGDKQELTVELVKFI